MSKPVSSIDRPLMLRLRPDVVTVPVEMAGARTWVVQDPLTLEHFQFSAEEYALLDMLRQPVSLAELQRAFGRQFPPQTITPQSIWGFLSRLHEAGLLISDAAGQGRELAERTQKERLRQWAFAWTRMLCIRFRGLDPDRFLTAAHQRLGWLFSRTMLVAAALLMLYAASLVVGHFGEFRARLPELSVLFDPRNLVWVLLAIGGVKVLHELGHAMACKLFGGQVHELGVMLLAFSPCLYCDVSDAWRLPNKWQRIFVSSAGVLVELAIASVATIVWWHSQPGLVNLVALDVMIVCSVSTLLVNGNPLLRYDGYYILSDLTESPNLWQRSRDVLRSLATRWFWRKPQDADPLVPARHRAWLAGYAVASKLYLSLVLVLIVWGLVHLLYPWHLQNVAYTLGFVLLGGVLVGPLTSAVRLAQNPVRRADLRQGRAAVVSAMALAVAIVVLAWPVSYYVRAPLVLLPADAARVYATVAGTLADALPPGAQVEPGQAIAQLENTDVELELARLRGKQELEQMRLAHLEALRGRDPEANDEIPAARATLADVTDRLAERRRDAERLTLVSHEGGTLIAAPIVEEAKPTGGRLPKWSGAILDRENRGGWVEPGTLVCLIGDPTRLSAVMLVDDAEAQRVEPGQTVRMQLDQLPGQVIEGTVVEVARRDAEATAAAAAERADLAPLLAGLVPAGPAATHYEVRVEFEMPHQELVIGGRGEAKIAAERVTLARRMLRWLSRTFRLPV
jgi:putative peptide zinc metalloprotease protein